MIFYTKSQSNVYRGGEEEATQSYSTSTIRRGADDETNKGRRMNATWYDIMVMAYLLNPAKNSYELAEVAWEYLHEQIPSPNDIAGGKGKTYPLALVPPEFLQAKPLLAPRSHRLGLGSVQKVPQSIGAPVRNQG